MSPTAPRRARWDDAAAAGIGLLLGLMIGVAGAFVIRYGGSAPTGLVLALATFLFAAVFTRSLAGPWAFVPLVVGAALGIAATAFLSRGGDTLLPLDRTSTTWLLGVAVLANVVAFLPRRWFTPPPAPRHPYDDDAPLAPDEDLASWLARADGEATGEGALPSSSEPLVGGVEDDDETRFAPPEQPGEQEQRGV